MEKRIYKIYTILLGILTAFVVVFSQLFLYQGAELCKKEKQETEAEQPASGATEDQGTFISLPTNSVFPSLHKEVSHEAIFLFEIFFNEEEQSFYVPDVAPALGKYFQTLFHIIISPNAP